MGTKLLVLLALIVPAASAQRRGFAPAGGPVMVRPSPIHSQRPRVAGIRNHDFVRSRFGTGLSYGWPYIPGWDYDEPPAYYGEDFAAGSQFPSAGNVEMIPLSRESSQPPRPASSVVHEYDFGTEVPTRTGERPTFTIVLKDGSTRAAAAGWISGGRLHYLDLQSRQQTLSPDLINRNATERANEAKNLNLELPPG